MKKENEGFVHLHVHTDYSLLDSLAGIDELLDAVEKQGARACAITDTANMFGAIEFYEKAKKRGIKPIIGAEVQVRALGQNSYGGSLILLVRNKEGYHNLVRIVSAGHIDEYGEVPAPISKDILKKYSGGLIALSGGIDGEIGKLLLEERDEQAREIALELSGIFGKDNFYLEIQDTQIDKQNDLNKLNICVSHHIDIPLVLTGRVHYIKKEDEEAYKVLRHGLKDRKSGCYLKSEEELRKKFWHVPEGLANTVDIAERCDLSLNLKKKRLPEFITDNGMDKEVLFDELVKKGINERYDEAGSDVQDRTRYEVLIIKELGLVDYFLIIWDIVNYAKRNGIPVGPGRGASTGSIVNYVLGITDIDPVRYGLLFERFLRPEKDIIPCTEIDIGYERRGEVLDYVGRKYSRENTCKVITFSTISSLGAIRDAAAAMGVPHKGMESGKEVIDIASRITGKRRRVFENLAGIAILDKTIRESMPLFKTSDGETFIGLDKNSIDRLGLLYMRFLGLRTLTDIEQVVKDIKREKCKELDLTRIPTDDKKTFEMLSNGDSEGVFQLVVKGMAELLKRLKPDKVEDIAGLLALYRPSTIKNGMMDEFIERKQDKCAERYYYPMLRSIIEETYGMIIYPEQLVLMLNALAGLTMAEALDMRMVLVRGASGRFKDNPAKMEALKERVIQGCLSNGFKKEAASQTWGIIEKYGPHTIPKSHYIAYAMISYRMAYLKANFPEKFEKIIK